LIVDVPAFNVELPLKSQTVPIPVNVTVDDPRFKISDVVEITHDPAVMELLFVFRVDDPERSSWPATVKLELIFTVNPGVYKYRLVSVFPFVETDKLPEAEILMAPVAVHVVPESIVKFPVRSRLPEPAIVPTKPVVASVPVPIPAESIVTVPEPLLASKIAASKKPGTEAPPAPPDVVDHLVPAVKSQIAAPPTQ
jgi:hypothetical protein